MRRKLIHERGCVTFLELLVFTRQQQGVKRGRPSPNIASGEFGKFIGLPTNTVHDERSQTFLL